MSCLVYRERELYIENVALKTIAAQFGTPCYVYSKAALETAWLSFVAALHGLPHRVCYAVKANSNLSVLSILAKLGAGFDIVSLGELERVLAAGGDPQKVIFSGTGKTGIEIEAAIRKNIYCIDVESPAELQRIAEIANRLNKTINIALRINPNIDPRTHVHISTGLKENKFGIDSGEIVSICKTMSSSRLRMIGIACHIGSQIVELEPFILAIKRLLQIYNHLAQIGIKLSHINIGGGLGITYHNESPPSITEYGGLLKEQFSGYAVEVILEPGRAIVGNAGILLTKIEYLKHTDHKNFAITDAGMNDLLRPALYNAWQNILPVELQSLPIKVYDIAGPVCESADFLGKNRKLSIKQGDLLAIDSAGAYGFSMCSNYNSRPRVAEILIDGDKAHIIRRRETIPELFAAEQLIT